MDALDSLFRRLVLSAHAAGAHARAIEIREVLDTFAPYGAVRRDGIAETNEDYLHLLMRLLAGEKGYVFADELLQDDLRSEIQSKNPDLAVLRTYVNAKLRLSSEHVNGVLAGDTRIDLRPATPIDSQAPVGVPGARTSGARAAEPKSGPSGSEPGSGPRASEAKPVAAPPRASMGIPTPAALVPQPTPIGGVAAQPRTAQSSAYPSAMGNMRLANCPYCAQTLPEGRPAKFCPSCGLNLLVRRCAGCSAEIEAGWKFCVTCGRAAT